MTFKSLILGLIGIVLGLLWVKYRKYVQSWTGGIAFAEKYFGPGGTYTLFLLLGSALVILSILFMFGLPQEFIKKVAGPYF